MQKFRGENKRTSSEGAGTLLKNAFVIETLSLD